jgi:hypothetical protein
VRDHQRRELHLVVQPSIFDAERIARQRIERAERLVHQHDLRPRGERARDADALALSSGERGRVARREIRAEADEREQLGHALCDRLARPADQRRRDADVLGDGQMRKQPDALEHVADPPPQLVWKLRACRLAVDQHLAVVGLEQPVDHLERRGLARARFADDRDELAGRHRKAHGAHGRTRVVRMAHALEANERRPIGRIQRRAPRRRIGVRARLQKVRAADGVVGTTAGAPLWWCVEERAARSMPRPALYRSSRPSARRGALRATRRRQVTLNIRTRALNSALPAA